MDAAQYSISAGRVNGVCGVPVPKGTRYLFIESHQREKNGGGEDVGGRDGTRPLRQMDRRLRRGKTKEFGRVEAHRAAGC